ncbi:MAG: GNAT family N-acetyltransferase [Negativicutes bacterium]|nr:GNAT family N-acetyltransferase [Negativicutes bacterium]
MEVLQVTERAEKMEIAAKILDQLPDWFGIPEATANNVRQCAVLDLWVARDEEKPIGFIALKQHFPEAAELTVLGILPEYHRQGVGRQLLAAVENRCRREGIRFLQVKTLDPMKENACYDRTRSFYLAMGFTPLETFPTLWDAANPCLQMIKVLEQTKHAAERER